MATQNNKIQEPSRKKEEKRISIFELILLILGVFIEGLILATVLTQLSFGAISPSVDTYSREEYNYLAGKYYACHALLKPHLFYCESPRDCMTNSSLEGCSMNQCNYCCGNECILMFCSDDFIITSSHKFEVNPIRT